MKTRTIIILGSLSILVSSCILSSLFPLFKESDLIRDDRIIGSWLAEQREDYIEYWTFEWLDTAETGQGFFGQDEWAEYNTGKTYRVTVSENSLEQDFAANLLELDGKTYIDFYPVDFEIEHNFLAWHMVPVHLFAQIEIAGNKLIFYWFDPDYFAEQIEQNKVKISHVNNNGQILITASTNELQKFVKKYGRDVINYSEPDTIPRIML
jgi:hypothetical protein